ncbi:hypothetical protein CON65_01085 [Bacillus pseudomycoides]|uniref:Uncharacterized protein n=1 Tax=Bacillus pseudomycoides TaxID=64104 RepID=A0AA91VFI4_9BACI|nr:hypothetical protein COO03_06160 [Bacillus sp. AFS098217]PED84407.1 hypothetical protein CON65_01085 [Bacillus pseudomycoides]PEU13249.1 hypothetical protein CN524_11800 [Bacillus sp. AFS019443]PEU13705.1 hypothetical protein CN525_18915 [Bacillus sp. AFS014408]PFW65482.1 hypothetical protein COL20_00370 [Bacillus sp. AFS075034]
MGRNGQPHAFLHEKLRAPTNIGEGKLHLDMDGQNMRVFAKSYFRLCLTKIHPHLTYRWALARHALEDGDFFRKYVKEAQ